MLWSTYMSPHLELGLNAGSGSGILGPSFHKQIQTLHPFGHDERP